MPFVPGHCHYFVVRTRRLAPVFSSPAAVQRLRTSMWRAVQRHPFTVDAVGFRPEAVFSLWTLPTGAQNYAVRWRYVRADFSRWYSSQVVVRDPGARRSPWQSRLHAVEVAGADEYERLLAHVRSLTM